MISIYLFIAMGPFLFPELQSTPSGALTTRIAALETRMVRLCVKLGWCWVKLHCGSVLWENFDLVSSATLQ